MCIEKDPYRVAKDDLKALTADKNNEKASDQEIECISSSNANIDNSTTNHEDCKLDWDIERAKAWHEMSPAS